MKNRIVIKIEGGVLVGVYAEDDNVDVELVDVDNINAGDDEQICLLNGGVSMKLMDLDWRKDKKCHFCGSKKSVKYSVTILDKFENKIEVPCCNLCAILNNLIQE